jgi:hypothetical protein
MSKSTLRILAGVERRLNVLLRLETSACGFEENIEACDCQRKKLMRYIRVEVEKLAEGRGS